MEVNDNQRYLFIRQLSGAVAVERLHHLIGKVHILLSYCKNMDFAETRPIDSEQAWSL